MAALGFFYRHQKMVFIIMAVLMVSFLIGYQGFNLLFSSEPGDQAIGETEKGELRLSEQWTGEQDLRIVNRFDRTPQQGLALSALLQGTGESAPLAYALLLREAEEADVRVFEADVDAFLRRRGYGEDKREELIARLRNALNSPELTEERVRAAIGNWLKIYKYFRDSVPGLQPTEKELRVTYRDMNERLGLQAGVVDYTRFLSDIPPPRRAKLESDERVREQFETYRETNPGTYPPDKPLAESFGFGYRWPEERARILYTLVSKGAIRSALGDTATEERVDEHTGNAADSARDMLGAYAELDERPEDMLKYFGRRGLTHSAESLLQRRLTPVHIADEPLADAVALLAASAREDGEDQPLRAIVLPPMLDRQTEVSLLGQHETVGEALGDLLEQAMEQSPLGVREPKWRFVRFAGLEDAVFCVAEGKAGWSLPVTPPMETDYLSAEGLRREFGEARTERDQHIAQLALGRAGPDGTREEPLVRVGEPAKDLVTPNVRIVWRVLGHAEPKVPEKLTAEIRRQVERDLKKVEAFRMAVEFAEEFVPVARESGLESAAEQAKPVRLVSVESFGRKSRLPVMRDRRIVGGEISWSYVEELMGGLRPPGAVYPPAPDHLRREVIERAFRLAGDDPADLVTIPYAPSGRVYVLARSSYEPPAEDEFATKRSEIAAELRDRKLIRAAQAHFSFENIKQRTGYTPGES